MAKVTGIGGVFIKSDDSAALNGWLASHLGIPMESWGGTVFEWREADAPERKGQTVFSVFKGESKYFEPSPHPFMINLRVDDLDGMLAELKAKGVEPVSTMDDPHGKFAHVIGPGGVKFELWQPLDAPEASPPA